MAEHQVKKQRLRPAVGAHVVVDQKQVRRDQPHDVGVKQIARPQRLFEDAQKVQLVGQKGRRVGHVDPALHQLVAGFHPLGLAEDPHQRSFALGVPGF